MRKKRSSILCWAQVKSWKYRLSQRLAVASIVVTVFLQSVRFWLGNSWQVKHTVRKNSLLAAECSFSFLNWTFLAQSFS